jgi:hypothetical protein
MFSAKDRARLRSQLLHQAASDPRISGAAITGSAADNSEDRWSDIDLAFGVRDAAELPNVLADWTAKMYDEHRALHHYRDRGWPADSLGVAGLYACGCWRLNLRGGVQPSYD